MSKFLVLYRATMSANEMMASSTPEQMKAGMDAWGAWMARVGPVLVDGGSPLGSGQHVEKGATAGSDMQVTGYSMLQADSMDAAVDMLRNHPHLDTPGGASIEVLESLPMPGM